MTSGVEALGDAVTGGVIARAVEPQAGEGTGGPHACLNCGTVLNGDFCHRCGQSGRVHRTLSAFWHDLLHGVLHFEGKIWRTLPMLVWRPGDLTRRYIAGERARFVSPLALFLFSIFFMFAVFAWTGGPVAVRDAETGETLDKSITRNEAEIRTKLAGLQRRRLQAIAARQPTTQIDADLKEARDSLSMMVLMRERGVVEAGFMRASDDLPESLAWLEGAYRKAKANPSLLIYKLQNNAYKYGWALIPISVPFLWLLFPFSRRFRIYDHAVFVTYSLCFMTLLMVVLSIFRAAGVAGLTGAALTLIPPIHMYRQLRGAYGQKWWSALLRTALLLIFCIVSALIFVLLLLALGVFG